MSLSLWLESVPCSACQHSQQTEELNYTYNVSPMWYRIFPDDKQMVDIDGMSGEQSQTKLIHALGELVGNPLTFIELNPKNGWGDHKGFIDYLYKLIKLAMEHPDYIWQSSR